MIVCFKSQHGLNWPSVKLLWFSNQCVFFILLNLLKLTFSSKGYHFYLNQFSQNCFRSQEFIRVGYYVSNEYQDPELQENPPEQPIFDKLTRNILASNPRVTKFKINWDEASASNGNGMVSHEGNGEPMASHEADENGQPMPPPPPSNPYLPERMRGPNPLPLQKDPKLVSVT